MHLDTVFSFCDRDLVTIFPEVVNQIVAFSLYPDESKQGGIDVRREESSFLDVVAKALGVKALRVVETGGNSFAAEREQWDDGSNDRPPKLSVIQLTETRSSIGYLAEAVPAEKSHSSVYSSILSPCASQ